MLAQLHEAEFSTKFEKFFMIKNLALVIRFDLQVVYTRNW